MKNTDRISALGMAAVLLLPSLCEAAEARKPFAPVADAVKQRTGRDVRWDEDATAAAESLRTVRGLLKKPLTSASAAQIALLNNRELKATFEDVGISAADLREAGLLKNPAFDLTLRFPDRPPLATDAEEAVAFDFLHLLMMPLRKRVAAQHLQAVQLRVAHEALKLVADAKSALYMLQADAQLIDGLKVMQKTNAAALDLSQKQHEAGNISDLALLQQQSAYSRARLEIAMADADMREHREKLNRLLGLWGADTDWKIAGKLPPMPESDPPLKGLESLAVSQRLDLTAAQSDLGGIVHALGLTKSYRLIGALEFGIDTEHNPDHSNVTGPTLRLELPVFNQGQARIAKAQAELRQAEWRFEGLAIEIRSEVRELDDRLRSKREIARFYHDELLPGSVAIVKQTQLFFNGMLMGTYELFAAKSEEVRAERGYIEALRGYWMARAELERAVGGSLAARQASRSESNLKETKPHHR